MNSMENKENSSFSEAVNELVQQAVKEMNSYPIKASAEDINRVYSEVAGSMLKSINAKRTEMNPSSMEFRESITDALSCLQHSFEEKNAQKITEAYFADIVSGTNCYSEIFEDSSHYANGLTLVIYDITEEQCQSLKDEDLSMYEESVVNVDMDNLHSQYSGIPDDFFDSIYKVNDIHKMKSKTEKEI